MTDGRSPGNDAPTASAVLLPGKRLTVNAVAVDAQDNIYVAGSGDARDVPGLDRGLDATPDGGDAFIAKLDRNGTPVWATYLGGTDQRSGGRVSFLIPDVANAIAIDAVGQVYVAGTTSASNFPVVGGFQASRAGAQDAFIAKLSADGRRLCPRPRRSPSQPLCRLRPVSTSWRNHSSCSTDPPSNSNAT